MENRRSDPTRVNRQVTIGESSIQVSAIEHAVLKRDDILDDSLLFALADDAPRNNNMGSIGSEEDDCADDDEEGNASIDM